MAITVVSQPAEVFPAYNFAPLVLRASNAEEEAELYFLIDGVQVSHHKREFFSLASPLTDNFGNPITDNDGYPIPIGGDMLAVFDLAAIARNFFSNALVEVNAAENAESGHVKSYADSLLGIRFVASITGVGDYEFTAVNAALPPGIAESDFAQQEGKLLTEFDTIKMYPGFSEKSAVFALPSSETNDRAIIFVGSIVPGTEVSISGTGIAGGYSVGFIVDCFVFGLQKTVYYEQAGDTAAQAAAAIVNFINSDQDLSALVSIENYTAGGTTMTILGKQPGYVRMTGFIVSMLAGIKITGNPIYGEERISTVTEGEARVVRIDYPTDLYPTAIRMIEGEEETDGRIVTYPLCTPDSPFYVRWINSIGGYEHWMFSRKQTLVSDVEDSVVYDPYADTNEDVGAGSRQLSLVPVETITAGAEGLTTTEFEVIRKMVWSPRIEYYDPELDKWMVLTIKKGTSSKDTRSPVQSLEFEFNLPQRAVQF